MGNQLAGIAPSQIFPVEYYFSDLQDCGYDLNLGSTRFFKVARAKHKEGLIVVKIFAIRDPSLPLKEHRERIDEIKKLLKNVPNALPFQSSLITDKAGILIRQYVKDNLYDRISTRPFLNSIEKRWITFQLLQCLSQCHELGVFHGDLKLENIMITSWNWILVTDFASFKPTELDEENPADFSYFFDTSRRRTCYIAPERFIKIQKESKSDISKRKSDSTNEKVDASKDKSEASEDKSEISKDKENFEEKSEAFDKINASKEKSDISKNKSDFYIEESNASKGNSDFSKNKLDITKVELDTLKDESDILKNKSDTPKIPVTGIATTTMPNEEKLTIPPSPSGKIGYTDEIKTGNLTEAMDIFSLGCSLTELYTEGCAPFDFSQLLCYRIGEYEPSKVFEKIEDTNIKKLVQSMMQKDPDARLSASEYLELQYDKAFPAYFYTFLNDYVKVFSTQPSSPDEKIYRLKKDIHNIIEVITSYEKQLSVNESSNNKENVISEGLVLIVALLTSLLRALKHCSAKLNALDVINTIACYLSPEVILDRLLPYLVFLARDKYPKVRVAVIQTITDCLALIKSIPRSDSNIFPEYILPNLAHIAHDQAVIVRMAYAENIASLAETALRFLEMTHSDMEPDPDSTFLSEEERNHHNKVSYDHELQALQELVQQSVTTLLSDPVNAVKQTLLERGIRRLCVFFGRRKGNDVLLSHMITYLNDKKDRHLRGAFFDAIVGVATYVGWQCCPILKPLLQQGLTDTEEFVISKTLCALSNLTTLGLLQKQMLYDLVTEAIPLLIHPNLWIKQAAVGFVCVVAKSLNIADVMCRLSPLLQPFLKQEIIQIDNELVLLNALQDPIPRGIFDFLIKLPTLRNLLESLGERKFSRTVARPGHPPTYREMDINLNSVYNRLQSDGMNETIEEGILAMKDHMLKVQLRKCGDMTVESSQQEDGEIDLAKIRNPPKTNSVPLVFAENHFERPMQSMQNKKTWKKKSTVESPTVTMNEEWQHMFGTNDLKYPSSPKLQHQESDPLLNSYISGKVTEEGLEVITTVDDKSTSLQLSLITDFKPNHCAPCREELSALMYKKREEWISDEIAREASEPKIKEEKAQSSKKYIKVPSGLLIAHLQEHRGSVNKIQVITGTALFATCSNDGTVKIWDCDKMEGRNVANRSRLSYNRLDGPVSCMTLCQNMQSIAAASENGNIHVFRVLYENTKSTLIHTRNLDPVEEGCVVDIDYFDTGSQSVLAYATVTGAVVGWDLRSPGTAWKLENNPRLGLITSFCTDPHHCWLVIGTARGNMVCWDLRFQLPITTVTHPTGSRIRHMLVHPKKRSSIFTSVQGNNEVSLWDMETQGRLMTLWTVNKAPPLSQTETSDDSVYAMAWSFQEYGCNLLTAGSDRRIRYWDLKNPASSRVIVGAANDRFMPLSNYNYNLRVIDGTEVICEHHPLEIEKDKSSASGGKSSSDDVVVRRYPETPQAGHYDIISALSTIQTSQHLVLSASKDGIVKVWK